MKRKLFREGSFLFFECSCGHYQAVNEAMPWCAECRVEYDVKPGLVVLRPGRKTARLAVGKAFNAAGGVRIGGAAKWRKPPPG